MVPRRLDDEPTSDIVFIGRTRNTLGVTLRVRSAKKIGFAEKKTQRGGADAAIVRAFVMHVIHETAT